MFCENFFASQMSVQQLLDELESRFTALSKSNDAKIDPVDHKLLWEVLFHVAQNEKGNFELFQTLLSLYREQFPSFNDNNEIITSKTADYLDSTKSFQERTVNSKAILQLIPYFNLDLAKRIVTATIQIADAQLKETRDIPIDFLEPLSDCDIEGIGEADTTPFIEFLNSEVDNPERSNAAILIFAPLSHGLCHLQPEVGTKVRDTLLAIVNKHERESNLAGCYLLFFAAHLFEHEPETQPEPSQVYQILTPLLREEDTIVRKRANKAYRVLLDSELLLDEAILKDFLKSFETFPKEYYPEFFKILSCYVIPHDDEDEEEDEEPNLSIIEPIVDFTKTHMKSEDPLLRSLCLDLMSDLGYKDFCYIEDDVEESLAVSEQLIKDQSVNTYIYIANLLETLADKYPNGKARIEQIVPVIAEQVIQPNNDQVGTLKQRIDCVTQLASITHKGLSNNQVPQLASYCLRELQAQPDYKIVVRLCNPIHWINNTMGEQNAIEMFKLLTEAFKTIEDQELCEDIAISSLDPFIKNYNIPEELVYPLVDDAMNGRLKVLRGSTPPKIFPPCIPAFMIIDAYIKKFPTKGAALLPTLLEWLSTASIQIVPPILIPINTALDSGCFTQDTVGQLATTIKEIITKCDAIQGREIGALSDTANRVFNLFPAKMEPIDEFLVALTEYATKASGRFEEEEEEVDPLTEEGLPDVANFVFNVYASNEDLQINEELLEPLLLSLPYENYDEANEVYNNLAIIFENKERVGNVLIPGLRIIAELLLLKKAELEQYKLEQDAYDALKASLKKCCQGDKKLVQALSSTFKGTKAKLNRFNALLR